MDALPVPVANVLGTGAGSKRQRHREADLVSSSSDEDGSSSSSTSSSTSSSAAKKLNAAVKVEVDSSSSSSDSEEDKESEATDLSGEEDVDIEGDGGPGVHKDLILDLPLVPVDPSYRGNWMGAPAVGTRGFNAFATKIMKSAGVASRALDKELDTSADCPPLQPHQEVVEFLLHPQSPVSRLLVDHPTGSGKTREMISVLDNFFHDPRPKVPIFPKEPVCRNFYLELLRWPSNYRNFFACLRPQDASRAAGVRDWRERRGHVWDISDLPDEVLRELCSNMREVLEMKGWFHLGKMRRSRREAFERRFPREKVMAAPLRALRYTSAGGRHTDLKDGLPMSSLLKVAFDYEDKNVYSNKIVIMDEVHNLVRVQTQFGEQLSRLREFLLTARGGLLAGFTGTPILSEAIEGRQLLDIVKGRKNSNANDQGFVSSFPMRPQPLFPRTLPPGVPDDVLTPKLRRQLVVHTLLRGESLKRYDIKRSKGLPERRLQRYCTMSIHFGAFHDGKNGCKSKVLGDLQSFAPKLLAIASAVASSTQKSLVLVPRSSGMDALLLHLQELGGNSTPPFGVATMDQIAAFNSGSNRHGERYRVLVADATTCAEGVSFFAVRQVHLADVPVTPSVFVQSVGRAVRMYGHRGLPAEEQTVSVFLHVANFPSWMRSPLGAWALRAQRQQANTDEMESKARRLLRQLQKAGINDIEALKKHIDASAQGLERKTEEELLKLSECRPELREEPETKDEAKMKVELKEEIVEEGKSKLEVKTEFRVKEEPCTEGANEDSQTKNDEEGTLPEKELLDTEQIATILEQFGLWEEAKAERERAQRFAETKPKKGTRRRRAGRAATKPKPTTSGPPLRPPATPLKMRPLKSAKGSDGVENPTPPKPCMTMGSMDMEMTLADLGRQAKLRQKPATVQASAAIGEAALVHAAEYKNVDGGATAAACRLPGDAAAILPSYWRRDALASAIQLLYLAASSEDAVQALYLNPLTADELALQQLSRRSREFVSALAELRGKAVDRAVLRKLGGEPKSLSSEGESSEREYVLSESDEEGPSGRQKTTDFILPPGWRTEKFRRKSLHIREFVDPQGTRYRTMPEARRAVDLARARENMSQRMRSKFAAALSRDA